MKEKFARWNVLFMHYFKRDWKKIIFWILGIGLFAGGFIPAFEEISNGQGLIGMFETMKNPAMISMVGPSPITSADDYTMGAMYSHEMLLFSALFAMIMGALHVVNHTRKEEELGLTELVRSYQVGRQANSLAVFIETVIINVLLAIVTSIIMISFDADTISVEGSLLFGLSVGIAGIMGSAIALMIAQVMPTASGAVGSSLAVVGTLYLARAATDVSYVGFSMLNPMGWTYLTYPFTNNNWLPLIYAFIFSLVVVVLAFVLEGGRDMGAGYLPEREGRAYAKQSLLSIPGLFIKLNKGVMLGWLVSFLIMGAAYGSIYGDMQTFIESNELIKQMFMVTGYSVEATFTGTIMMVLMGLVCILPIVIVNKLFTEESRLHLSQLYSTKVTRALLYWTSVIIAIVAGAVGILLASYGLGGTAIAAMVGESTLRMEDFMAAGFNFFPTVLFFAGLAGLTLGWLPKLGKVIYAYLGYSFTINYFGGILDLPEWFEKTAILSWIPRMPVEEFDIVIFITMTGISISLLIFGLIGYCRRDMVEGA